MAKTLAELIANSPEPPELLPGSTPPPAYLSWPALPLIELVDALDAHAARIAPDTRTPLAPDTLIPAPAGLPERMLMPVDMLIAGRYQPRQEFEQAAIDELAESIREHGVLNPLLVFANEHGRVELIAGERRLRAARQAGLGMVPIEFRPYTLLQIAEISGIDNIQRAQLSPLEEGRYYSRLITELKISENQLAKRLGQNRAAVQQRRAIASAAPELQQALTEGKLSFSQARAIAQAAPGELATQKKALGDVLKRLSNGQAVSENEARKTAEKTLRDRLLGDLNKLGWQLFQGELIYSSGDRPRAWTGAEMLAAVSSGKRPSPAIAEAEISPDMLKLIKMRFRTSTAGPWVGLSPDWATPSNWYAPGELEARAEEVTAALDAFRARAAAHGWTLEINGDANFARYKFTTAKGAEETTYYWTGLEETVKKIEAGQVADAPSPSASRPSAASYGQSYAPECTQCKQKSPKGVEHMGNGQRLCPTCAAPLHASRKQRRASVERAIEVNLGTWLRAAPAGAWPLLIGSLVGEIPDETSTADWLIDQLASTMLEVDPNDHADEYEQSPSALALAERIFTEAASPTPAAEADEAPAGDELLAAVDRRLDQVDANWAERGWAPSLDLLDDIGEQLNAGVDDPEVSDAAYEQRTERLRLLYQRRLAEAEAVAA